MFFSISQLKTCIVNFELNDYNFDYNLTTTGLEACQNIFLLTDTLKTFVFNTKR